MPGEGGDPGDAGDHGDAGEIGDAGDPGDPGEFGDTGDPGYGYAPIAGDMPASGDGGVIVAYTVVVITDVTKKNNSNKISIFPILANFCLSIYFSSRLYNLERMLC